MKKNTLINSEISYLISKMGHMDQFVIGDAGLPIPNNVQRIDLAVSKGIPDFLSVFHAVLSEQKIEKVIMAEEIKLASLDLHKSIVDKINLLNNTDNMNIEIEYVSHEEFKIITKDSKAVIRTGEFKPYANIILVSGVVF